ncbi:hypothetical protein ACQP1O_25215 [Nocardia sp. CA-151230]|uniref:hypothetical protein n=1 Tax=Nocardia sp. CA-151230 TaxID=3239982 RepID=UPI003D91DA62
MLQIIERYRTSGSWFSRAAGAHTWRLFCSDGDDRLFCSDGDRRPRPDGMLIGRAAASLAAAF